MKFVILKITLYFKALSIIGRIIFIGVTVLFFGFVIIPDSIFNLTTQNAKEFTIEELHDFSKTDIPRYIKIRDARLLKSHGDSTGEDGYLYLRSREINKNKDTVLRHIIYPVYSNAAVVSGGVEDAAMLTANVLILDSKVTEKELEGDGYFMDSKFTIEGRYNDTQSISKEIEQLKAAGFKVDENVILLSKGVEPASWTQILVFGFIGTFLTVFSGLSFIPIETLVKFLT